MKGKLLGIGVVLMIVVIILAVPATTRLADEKKQISQALASAKEIRLEHYRTALETGGSEQIIASKNLAPKDFHRVGDAFPLAPDVGLPGLTRGCLFNPHHRLIITDALGKRTVIEVCFECDHVGIRHGYNKEGGEVVGTPFVWMITLRHFFAEEGMPNSPQLYHRTEPPAAAASDNK